MAVTAIEEVGGIGLVYAGLGAMVTGGFLTALGVIATVSFGLLPTGLFGIGAVLIGAGIYERFVLRK